MVPIVVAILVALSVVGGGVVYASESAPPTSPLHPVKVVVNNAAGSLRVAPQIASTSTPTPRSTVEKAGRSASESDDPDRPRAKATMTPLPSPVASAVATLEAGLDVLATDTAVPGNGENGPQDGLDAKLDAAVAAMGRGDTKTANDILDAFAHQLNALERSGHISEDDYTNLYNQYTALLELGDANATPVPSVTPHARGAGAAASQGNQHHGKGNDGKGHDVEATAPPSASAGTALNPTPTPQPHGRGNPNRGRGHS